jgi:hypothetical protein
MCTFSAGCQPFSLPRFLQRIVYMARRNCRVSRCDADLVERIHDVSRCVQPWRGRALVRVYLERAVVRACSAKL